MNKKSFIILVFLFPVACNHDDPALTKQIDEYLQITEGVFNENGERPFLKVSDEPQSTFSLDVDTASYTSARGEITSGKTPEPGRIRTEEFTNYFSYPSTEPVDSIESLGVTYEISIAPWAPKNRLVKAIVKAKEVPLSLIPPLNLVFLIDVSGSMSGETRLGLAKYALTNLVSELRAQDKISIVTYSDEVATLISGASGDERENILAAVNSLNAGGGTAGHSGIQRAYDLARENFLSEGLNRVVLSTDGDFNVGISDEDLLAEYVGKQASEGVYLTVHGYGRGNFNDSMLEKITNKGNGNYSFIDSRSEAQRVFKLQISKTLSMAAEDVKVQVDFDPQGVEAYRLLGYENRRLKNDEFEDERIDAGDLGSGHTVVALYEIKFKSENLPTEPLKVLKMKLRYRDSQNNRSIVNKEVDFYDSGSVTQSHDHCFASSVAAFALKLRDSSFLTDYTYQNILDLTLSCGSLEGDSDRLEFIDLVEQALNLEKI